ncbi:hypothetical protein TOPH_02864, partial [Tolypocladium ophioglossoides CBS 100239]
NERRISFRHPAYPASAPDLLCLSAVDGGLGVGIDYNTALVACGIVAGNRWHEAWFGEKRPGSGSITRVEQPADGILRSSSYYFYAGPDPDDAYPVVPSFDHWRFPHDDLPLLWATLQRPPYNAASVMATRADPRFAVQIRDRTCRITGYYEAGEVAHLVPANCAGWFESNQMKRYCGLPSRINPVNDERNMFFLRRDLHQLFDRRRFVLVPKTAAGTASPTLVIHVLLPLMHLELHSLYHNRALQEPVTGITVEALFARFAWSTFCDENFYFLKGEHQYGVRIFNPDVGEVITKRLDAVDIRGAAQIFHDPFGSRSVSSQKRKVAATEAESVDYELWRTDSEDEDEQEYEEEDEDDTRRGRCRYRFHYDQHLPQSLSPQPERADSSFSTVSAASPNTEDGPPELGVHVYDGEQGRLDKRPLPPEQERNMNASRKIRRVDQ